MNHAVLPFVQPPKKSPSAKDQRQQRKQNEINIKTNPELDNIENNLNLEDRQKLVSAFAWLIQEDQKQNPSLYQTRKTAII